jgi:hypothetical protein
MVETIALLGTLLPFGAVTELLARLTRVHVAQETTRVLTEGVGEVLVEIEEEERAELAREWPAALPGPEVQQISVDGSMIPLVGGQWAEAKTLAVGEVQRDDAGVVHTHNLSYFSRMTTAETFVAAVYPELHRRGTERAGTVCAVMDGAEWLQRVSDAYRPDAVRILDFAHAAEHVGNAGRAVWGIGSAALGEWLGTQLHELRHGDPVQVLAAIGDLPVATAGDPVAARLAQQQELAYLEKRRESIAYAQFHASGYPIGSGAVESANKLVVEARLKGAGMHWAPHNINPVLALRACQCSGRWSERWPEVSQRLHQRHRAQQRSLWASRRPPTPSPEVDPLPAPTDPSPNPSCQTTPKPPRKGLVEGGKPTAHHPWQHAHLSGSNAK